MIPVERILHLQSVDKRYGPRNVLQGVTLEVQRGEVVCFVGPSGTGKSTLLRCVNGLEPIQGGTIEFERMPVISGSSSIRDIRKRIGMIFQNFNLYPHLTAAENVMLAPVVVHGERRDATLRERVVGYFEKVRLTHRMNAYPAELSGGEQQRVAIARALATNPHMLMFDEPTSALDPETVGDVLAVMRDLAEEGRTMLIVTHEIRFAAEAGSRMIFMDEGKIVENGDPREMIRNPQTARAKQFLSSIKI